MTASQNLTVEEATLIDSLVEHYRERELGKAERLAEALLKLAADRSLRPHIHSLKMRAKDPEHLRDKLRRKLIKCKTEGVSFL